MKDSTKKAVDKAIDNYRNDMADAATTVAIEAHISGDIAAHAAMGIPIGKMEVQKEALLFGRKYKKLLKETGGTVIQGKRIDWLASHTEDTRKAVYETIRTGLIEGKPVADIGGKLGVPGTVAHDLEKLVIRDAKYKYVRIARTETAAIQNRGTLNRFKKSKITQVEVIDGTDFDEACAEANGQIWTTEYAASHELEHPNCTRSFSPVIPDDWEVPDEAEPVKKPKITTEPVVPTKLKVPSKPLIKKPSENALYDMDVKDFSQRKKLLKNADREAIDILDENGNVVASNVGKPGAGYVDVPEYAGRTDPNRRLTFHHNHPEGGAFSEGDLRQLSNDDGLSKMWAHEKNASHLIELPDGVDRHDLWVGSKNSFKKFEREAEKALPASASEAEYVKAMHAAADKALAELHEKGLIKYTKFIEKKPITKVPKPRVKKPVTPKAEISEIADDLTEREIKTSKFGKLSAKVDASDAEQWDELLKRGWPDKAEIFSKGKLRINDVVHFDKDGNVFAISRYEIKSGTLRIKDLEINSALKGPEYGKAALRDIADDGLANGATEINISAYGDAIRELYNTAGLVQDEIIKSQFSADLKLLKELAGKTDLVITSRTKETSKITRYLKKLEKSDPEKLADYKSAVNAYTTERYKIINSSLRDGIDSDKVMARMTSKEHAALKREINTVSEYLEDAPKFKGEVYRGVGFDDKSQFDDFISTFQGNTHTTSPQFTSSSIIRTDAEYFKGRSDYSATLKIKSNEGSYIGGLSDFKDETEVLFNHGAEFKIKNIVKVSDKHYDIELEDVIK